MQSDIFKIILSIKSMQSFPNMFGDIVNVLN